MITNNKWLLKQRLNGKKSIGAAGGFLILFLILFFLRGRLPACNGKAILAVCLLNMTYYLVSGIYHLFAGDDCGIRIQDKELLLFQIGKNKQLYIHDIVTLIAGTGKDAGIYLETRDGDIYYLDGRGISCKNMKRILINLQKNVSKDCRILIPDYIEWKTISLSLFVPLIWSALSFLLPGILCLLS